MLRLMLRVNAVQLLGPLEKFTRAKRLGVDVSIQAPQVSFTVWAKADPIFVKGYIVQKKLIKSGYGSDLSCWGEHPIVLSAILCGVL
jgi:hypothetical protein